MCGSVEGWTTIANRSRYLGIAVLFFAIINVVYALILPFEWSAFLGSILGIVSGSLLLCCGPGEPPLDGCNTFVAATALSAVAGVLHFISAIFWLVIVNAVGAVTNPWIVMPDNPFADLLNAVLIPFIILNFITGSLNFAYAVVTFMASTSMRGSSRMKPSATMLPRVPGI
jgi:hypothetical protein